jgi:hypothetical protein
MLFTRRRGIVPDMTMRKIGRSADVPALGAKYSSVGVGRILLPNGFAPSSPAALASPSCLARPFALLP